MNKVNEKSQLKKDTFRAWTGILLSRGMIDVNKYNKMIAKIDKLND